MARRRKLRINPRASTSGGLDMIDTSRSRSFMVPNDPTTADVRANADLLRCLAAAIGLSGALLAEVCERIFSDIRAEVAPIDGAVRLDPSPDTVEDA